MIFRRLLCRFLPVLLALPLASNAEDIDLFTGTPSGVAPTPPNVLFMIDNTANWNTAFTNEIAALVNVFNGLSVGAGGSAKFNVGVMFFTETGNPNNNTDGGYVRAAIRPMSSTNKATYAALLNSLNVLSDKSNGGKAGLTMAEAYRYFSSGAVRSGNNKVKADYTGNTSGSTQSNAVYALSGNAISSFTASSYAGPNLSNCAKNYIIYISNGAVQDNNSDTTTATTLLGSAGGSTTAIPISPSGSQDNVADEWARFMRESPQQITIYTLDIDKVTNGQGPGWTALLKSMASVSNGKYFEVSSGAAQNIVDALNTVLSEILAVNSVFASVSLPAASNAQSTFLNQVFIGMFRPDADALPRWPGNLQQYKLGLVSGSLKLLDVNGNAAINANTGFITECSRSTWTPASVDTYWATQPQGDCNAVANSDASNYPDGPVVEKGGQGYVLRSSTTRTVKTCSATFASCTSLIDFNTSATTTQIPAASVGAATTTERNEIINWQRGLDVKTGVDERINGITSTEMRASVHGDVVHSRPVAINYGTDASPQVVVYYSANDGMLRAINGNRSSNIGTSPAYTPGQEIWSFIAPEFWSSVRRQYDNSVIVSYPVNTSSSSSSLAISSGSKSLTVGTGLGYSANKALRISYDASNYMDGTITSYNSSTGALVANITSVSGSGTYASWKVELGLPKPYAVDGPITAYQGAVGGVVGNKVFLYAGMRRGGRALYAFDVTSATSPSLKWKRGCPNLLDDTNCTNDSTNGDWRDIGQTWSPATLVKAGGYASSGTPIPLLLMGGGYDRCEDTDNGSSGANNSCSSTKGNRIYVIDSNTGVLLKTFTTVRGVAGAITPVTDNNGLLTYAYAADTGGNLYRISGASAGDPIGSTAPANWNITRIAALGCDDGGSSCTRNRKFLFGPDVVAIPGGGYAALIGSGDREKPLGSGTYGASNNVQNHFFRVDDQPSNNAWLSQENSTCGGALLCRDSLTPIPSNSNPTSSDLANRKGWYLPLASTENVVTSAITVSDTVTFSTFKPAIYDANACSGNLGEANVYNINYSNGAPAVGLTRYQRITGDGLPPSPVAGKVILDDGTVVPFLIGGSGTSPLEGGSPAASSNYTAPKGRVYWHVKQ